jgi:ribosomal protein L37AE/L43A
MTDVIRFICPECGQKYRAPSRLAGRARACVKCASPFNIPSENSPVVKELQHVEVAAVSQTVEHEAVAAVTQPVEHEAAERIPPAGPVSQFAAALSESSVVTDPEPIARQFTSEPELPPVIDRHPCPFCGEDILKTAVKCKHCGEFLSGNGSQTAAVEPVPPVKPSFQRQMPAQEPTGPLPMPVPRPLRSQPWPAGMRNAARRYIAR